MFNITPAIRMHVGQDGSVSIAVHYGLDGLGIESRKGTIFRSLGPTHPPVRWMPGRYRPWL
jgi:hypothetical protein